MARKKINSDFTLFTSDTLCAYIAFSSGHYSQQTERLTRCHRAMSTWLVLVVLLSALMPHADANEDLMLRRGATSRDRNEVEEVEGGHMFTLYGGIASLGEYYVHVDLGMPTQRLRVQVDTGSSSLIVPALECTTCHRPSARKSDRRRRLQQNQQQQPYKLSDSRKTQSKAHNHIVKHHQHQQHQHAADSAITIAHSDTTKHQHQHISESNLAKTTAASNTVKFSIKQHNAAAVSSMKDEEEEHIGEDPADSNGASAWSHVSKFYARKESTTGERVSCGSSACGSSTCALLGCGFPSSSCGVFWNFACCSKLESEACGFYLEYGGDSEYSVSASGSLVTDQMTLTNSGTNSQLTNPNLTLSASVTFYRTLSEDGPWPSQVDGILGLAFPALNCNPTCTTPAYETLLRNASPSGQLMFAMCFGDQGGKLVLGGDGRTHGLISTTSTSDTDVHGDIPLGEIGEGVMEQDEENSPIHYVALQGWKKAYYQIEIQSMQVNNMDVSGGSGGVSEALVDSGTTLVLLQHNLWEGFVHTMQRDYCHVPGICASDIRMTVFTQGVCLSALPENFFPELSFVIGGSKDGKPLRLVLPPRLYFIAYPEPDGGGSHVYCLGVQKGGPQRTVLGDTLLRGFVTVFDRDNLQVGFALPDRTTCGRQDADGPTGAIGRFVSLDADNFDTNSTSTDIHGNIVGGGWGLLDISPTARMYLSGVASGTFLALFVLLVMRGGTHVLSIFGIGNNSENRNEEERGLLNESRQEQRSRRRREKRNGWLSASTSSPSPSQLPALWLGPAAVSDPQTPTSLSSRTSSFGTFPKEGGS